MTLSQAFRDLRLDGRQPTADDEVRTLRAWMTRCQEIDPAFTPETWMILDAALNDLQIELRESGARTVEDLEAYRRRANG